MKRKQLEILLQTGEFEGKPLTGELIETHISWVAFTAEYAFKIKKPAKFSFLDFSDRAKRKYFCEEELRLNRRLTDIYLDVQEIKDNDGKFEIGAGKGQVLDYAVRMLRMNPDNKMDEMLERNAVSVSAVRKIAEKLADFHRKAKVVKPEHFPQKLRKDFNDVEAVNGWIGKHLGSTAATTITRAIEYSNSFLEEHQKLFRQRLEEGFYRDVHGDLHSKNIFLYPDPVIFDCIEFNENFRHIDLLDELAFFCMDLERFNRQDLSEKLLVHYQKYLPCMRSSREEALLNYYKCYRANVRLKVEALKAREENQEPPGSLWKYVELIERYTRD